MKARGEILKDHLLPWKARFFWEPVDVIPEAYVETGGYVNAQEAKMAAESYAQALGLEIEWEGTR